MKSVMKKINLTSAILIALLLGIVTGFFMQGIPDVAKNYIQPFGTIFLNLIKMIVVPLVVFSIAQGVISLKDIKKVGSIGLKTLLFYLFTTALAVTFGLLVANVLQVGSNYIMGGAQEMSDLC